MAIEGLTQSSTNLGVITTSEHSVLFDHLIRSCIDASTFDLLYKMETLAKLFGMTVEKNTISKAWAFEANCASYIEKYFMIVILSQKKKLFMVAQKLVYLKV